MFDDIGAVGNGHDKLVLSFVSFCIVATSDYRREILGLGWSDFRRVILGLVWKKNAGGTTAGHCVTLVPLDVFRWHFYWRSVLPNFGGFTASAFNSSRAMAMATAMVYC